MISRKPLGDRNDNPQKDGGSPSQAQQKKNPSARLLTADGAFVSPETICRPKLSASRRSSPANSGKPITSFRLEDASDTCHVTENELPSKAIADLWTKPLKSAGQQVCAKATKGFEFSLQGSNTPNRWSKQLSATKLSFDSCGSSSDETSPQPVPACSRKNAAYRRSLSYTEPESCKKDALRLLHGEGTPVCNPKRLKQQVENDENSPYKSYLEPFCNPSSTFASIPATDFNKQKPVEETSSTERSSSLTPEVKRLCFTRSQSKSALIPTCSIKRSLERIESDPGLIGDGSKPYILPIKLNGKHPDLKEITGGTLVELMDGKMGNTVTSFKLIDCRYPYEYDGGHIKGAINLFTKKQVYEELMQPKVLGTQGTAPEDRHILIFHCEFSSQRGSDMCRFLRDSDRESNASLYPNLYYPELYVLFGGYKAFFEQFPKLCVPQTYLPMDHPNHQEDCRRFKSRPKLEYPENLSNRSKKSKSQLKFGRTVSFAKKCNF